MQIETGSTVDTGIEPAPGIRFSLLGPVRASYAGAELDLGPSRERTMLAVLLCRANDVMSGEELLDAVWDDNPPGSGVKVIPTYIYRLRRALAGAADVVTIDSVRDGYVLRTDLGNLDVTRFSRAVSLAREPVGERELDTTRAELTEALALWRGAPFAGLGGPLLAAERRKLEEQRLGLLEERLDLELRCGQHAQVVGELQALCAAHPLRERFAALLMIALYRSGRQADALAVYNDARRVLRDSLGIDPGAELAGAHQAVLRCDDRLAGRIHAVTVSQTLRRDLPAAPSGLIGRDAEERLLRDAESVDGTPTVLTVDGMAGVGKTALALRVAHGLAERHPDGELYLDLHGFSDSGEELDAAEALRRLLVAAGVSDIPESTAERASLWRSLLAGRRALLVLDNAARSDVVQPLLPGTSGCTTLVVGRRRLYGLPVTTSVSLSPLAAESSRRLLGQLLGERLLVEHPAAVSGVLTECAGLPLALVRAAAGLRDRDEHVLLALADRLAADPLRALRGEADSLGSVFAPCVRARSAAALRVFRALRATPRPVTEIAEELGMEQVTVAEAVQELLDAGLAMRAADGFHTHPLLAAYAVTLG